MKNSNFKTNNPENMKLCKRDEWNDRMIIESVLFMLTVVCQFKKAGHRVWVTSKHTWPIPWPPLTCGSIGLAFSTMPLALFI